MVFLLLLSLSDNFFFLTRNAIVAIFAICNRPEHPSLDKADDDKCVPFSHSQTHTRSLSLFLCLPTKAHKHSFSLHARKHTHTHPFRSPLQHTNSFSHSLTLPHTWLSHDLCHASTHKHLRCLPRNFETDRPQFSLRRSYSWRMALWSQTQTNIDQSTEGQLSYEVALPHEDQRNSENCNLRQLFLRTLSIVLLDNNSADAVKMERDLGCTF